MEDVHDGDITAVGRDTFRAELQRTLTCTCLPVLLVPEQKKGFSRRMSSVRRLPMTELGWPPVRRWPRAGGNQLPRMGHPTPTEGIHHRAAHLRRTAQATIFLATAEHTVEATTASTASGNTHIESRLAMTVNAKTALVSGASRGIGLGIATRLASHGYALTITARDSGRLQAVADQLRAAGATEIVTVAADMSDTDAVARVLGRHEDCFGALSALILNAGVGTAGTLADSSMHRFDKMLAVNLRAPLQIIHGALPMLRTGAKADPERGAKVIALASIAGVYSEAGLSVYGAAKAALISLIATLNTEESGNGVTATTISPGYVDTEMSGWVHNRIPPEQMLSITDVVEMADALLHLSARAVVSNLVLSRAGTTGYHA